MVTKELNAAFSDEKVREQWLKRILPALVITVIYFVFISNTLISKANKAEDAYKVVFMKGITEDALPPVRSQISEQEIRFAALKKQDEAVKADLMTKAAFLYGQNDANAVIDQVSQLMVAHQLRVINESSLGSVKLNELPRSFAQLKGSLGDVLAKDEGVPVHRLTFVGHYADVYQALREIALNETKAMPLFLSMAEPDKNDGRYFGMKIWTLDLWI